MPKFLRVSTIDRSCWTFLDDDLYPNISVENSSLKYHPDVDVYKDIAAQICKLLGVDKLELCVRFVDNDEIHKLNKEYRGFDRPTDVLAFPQVDWDHPVTLENNQSKTAAMKNQHLGDIVISLEMANENATHINQPFHKELAFLITHGVLHLCGHDHKDAEEEEVMTSQQKAIMNHTRIIEALDKLSLAEATR